MPADFTRLETRRGKAGRFAQQMSPVLAEVRPKPDPDFNVGKNTP